MLGLISPGPTPCFDIQPFSLAEVQGAMFKMRCGRGADGDGLVFKHDPPCLHGFLFSPVPFALRGQQCQKPSIALLKAIYFSRTGVVYGGRPFDIQRGVKRGDILSPNALGRWTLSCELHQVELWHYSNSYILPPRKRGRPLFIKRGDKLSHCIMDGLRRLNFHHGKMRGSTSFHLL